MSLEQWGTSHFILLSTEKLNKLHGESIPHFAVDLRYAAAMTLAHGVEAGGPPGGTKTAAITSGL
jgi:hypothetical protein